ncbi:unnamed protein product [Arabis nemorensis]|uniref:RRM domain-containing protein n=1 Tax=Arabis nemorensis TaxID=586526 RepID=A0A565B1S0_9BRAS|nr:unnamed protein product [Arabis nemorensis]
MGNKKQKTSLASSPKSLKEGKSMTPCSQSKANQEKFEKPDEDEQIVARNVETAPVSSSKSSTDSKANPKKRKEKSEKPDEDEQFVSRNEFKEMKKSIKELSKAMKKLQEILLSKTNLLEASLKEIETPKKKEEETPKKKEEPKSICCFDVEEAYGNNSQTLFVKGFENLRPRDEIKKDLTNIFGSCGEVTRVFVPIECKIRLPLGFAFINLKNGEGNDKALELSGTYMGGRELNVKMATESGHYYGFTNFAGCDRCLGPPREPESIPHYGEGWLPRAKIPDALLDWFA